MDRHHHQPHWSNFGILGGIFVGATVILTVLAICVDRRRQVGRSYQDKTRNRQWRGESSEARQTNVRHPSQGARALGGVDNASALGAVTAAGVLIPGMDTAAGGGGGVISVDGGGGGGGGGGGW